MSDTTEPPVEHRVAATLWGDPPARRRGPKPRLSRDSVVAAAIGVADGEGLASLSMQRVADELGCAKMAIYRHVPGRDELLALMVDSVFGPPPELTDTSWRDGLRHWALGVREVFRRHPWSLDGAAGGRVMGPNELAWLEAGLAVFRATGTPRAERLDAVVLVLNHIRGLVHQGRTGPSEASMVAATADVLGSHGDRFPEVAAAFSADPGEVGARDNALEFGLERIFDGLDLWVRSAGR
ncbi:TetR/AcrR family transcriptional regulator [Spiractinospora alimapuensis]|uniref:TetR/AcrR family transcriptional regulator n=1 Tax=Spiractinospora alimapuensis TaxID=2820884 RepID=UPI001F4480DA|nr:TetR/AcrR family transcriptional regulator C-terminal domain-containing protein [Spiractinospora alimapuensis]QVQ50276.1 TetR/AcrR family transcriptional regulator [Spiractinospora alimapuensis]